MSENTEQTKNQAAVALGKLARGKRKTLTEEERQRRRAHLATVRAKRWPAPELASNAGDLAPACPECSATGQHYRSCSQAEE